MKKIFAVFVVLLFCGVCFAGSGPYPNKQFGQDLGKDGRSYNDLYLKNKVIFEGNTSDAYETTFDVTEPTADRTITFPDSSGTVVLTAPGATYSFEGATTADRTITLPDASGSPVLSTGVPQATNSFWGASNSIVFEGATADEFEISLVPADAAADATVTIPAKTGTIALLTQTVTAKTQADTPVTVSAGDAGQIYDNTGAGGAVVFNLPEASTVIGKSFTFCVTAAQNLVVNPADGDTILGLTNAAGDAIRNATLGGSITLTVLDAANIVATAYQGTWDDVD